MLRGSRNFLNSLKKDGQEDLSKGYPQTHGRTVISLPMAVAEKPNKSKGPHLCFILDRKSIPFLILFNLSAKLETIFSLTPSKLLRNPFQCFRQSPDRGRTYAKKLRFLRKKKAGCTNLKMPCVYCTQKTVTSHIKMRLVFSFFAPSREGL